MFRGRPSSCREDGSAARWHGETASAEHRTILVVDVERFARLTNPQQVVVREGLYEVLERAGDATNFAFRLLDAPSLRRALASARAGVAYAMNGSYGKFSCARLWFSLRGNYRCG
jgi:hypothetical protein